MVPAARFELALDGLSNRSLYRLGYAGILVRGVGLEPTTGSL